MHGRHVELEGAWNFRDLGGIRARNGRRIREGLVFRADALHRLTPNDQRALGALGIGRVFDLRSERELAQDGIGEFAAADDRHRHTPLVAVTLSPFDPSIDWKSLDLSSRYAQMLAEGGAVVAQVLASLGEQNAAPTVFHCTAGKDRTGVLAALLLLALGVERDLVVEDYAQSEAFLAHLLSDRREALIESGLDIEAVAYLTTSPPERMAATLEYLDSELGGAEAYLDSVGVLAKHRAALRERLLD